MRFMRKRKGIKAMENMIKEMGLIINKMHGVDNFYEVTGDSDKLKELRKILDEKGYHDDSPMAPLLSDMVGRTIRVAKEFINTIMICDFGVGDCGYLALED